MIIFYTTEINDQNAYFRDEEARHCSKVLRKRVGDIIVFTDGLGFFYEGTILNISKTECVVDIKKKWEVPKHNYSLTIAISPTKNQARIEWFLEKVVEIGIDRIIPLICKRTEKRNLKRKRLDNILISASKQSLKAHFPVLDKAITFEDFIKSQTSSQTYIAHLNKETKYLGRVIQPSNSVIILIGPEGDFTDEELKMAFDHNISPVTLGNSRLRTETAGVVACQIVNTINELA